MFVSDKLAEEITLTIGQAFDLAYRRFLETSGKDLEMKKQLMILQKRVKDLEIENSELKSKLNEYQRNGSKYGSKTHQSKENGNHNSTNGTSVTASKLPPLQPPPQVKYIFL